MGVTSSNAKTIEVLIPHAGLILFVARLTIYSQTKQRGTLELEDLIADSLTLTNSWLP